MFYIFIMCGGCWVCNRTAVVDGGGAFGCPHIVASRQCGVTKIVTARAVNIGGNLGYLSPKDVNAKINNLINLLNLCELITFICACWERIAVKSDRSRRKGDWGNLSKRTKICQNNNFITRKTTKIMLFFVGVCCFLKNNKKQRQKTTLFNFNYNNFTNEEAGGKFCCLVDNNIFK